MNSYFYFSIAPNSLARQKKPSSPLPTADLKRKEERSSKSSTDSTRSTECEYFAELSCFFFHVKAHGQFSEMYFTERLFTKDMKVFLFIFIYFYHHGLCNFPVGKTAKKQSEGVRFC